MRFGARRSHDMGRIPKLILPIALAMVINIPSTEQTLASSGAWTTEASMPTPRWNHAVGVVNGILYAVGGFDGKRVLGTVEAYNPATNMWTTRAAMPSPRSGLATGVVNSILFAVGGGNDSGPGAFGTVEAYNPSTNTWMTKPSMPTLRYGLAVGVVNNILYAVGGGNRSTAFGKNEAFKAASGN